MIAASVGVLLTVLGASAGPTEPTVRWEAPPECGTASELRDRVRQQLGTLEADLEISGRVRQADGLYVLELELVVGGEHQRRSFSAVDCSTLLEAAAIVGSAALGPTAAPIEEPEPAVPEPARSPEPEPAAMPAPTAAPARSPGSEPEDVLTPSAAPAPGVAPARPLGSAPASADEAPDEDELAARHDRPRRGRPGQWLVSARVGGGHDGTAAMPIGSLGFGRLGPRWRVQALIDGFGTRARGAHGALDLRVVTVSPRACARIRPGARVELSPCAGLAAGAAVGHGRGLPNARTAVVPWVAAHLDFGLAVVPRRWLAVGLELSNYVMLGRPRFVLSDQRTVYRAGPAGSRAFVTVELRFSATDRRSTGH